jgi:hypothetical protein
MKAYGLEIYEPDATETVVISLESDQPFQTISRGDLVNQGFLVEGGSGGTPLLRVVNVEHIVWVTNGAIKHKVCVYTAEVESSNKTRLSA